MTANIKTIVDAYATRTNFVDFNLADDINALQNALEALANMTFSQAAFANVETLAAAKTLTDDSAVVQMLNPNSANRDVNLPALAVTNHPFLIGNTNGSNYLLTVKNAGGTEIRVVSPGKFFLFFSDGNQWFYSGSDIYKTISPSQITANQNDYNPTGAYEADILRLNSDAARDITGLAGGSSGRIKIIHNIGSYALTLKDESGSSTAANRFALSADIALAADQSVILIYDATSSRWRSLGASSSGGASFWTIFPGTPVRVSNTTFTVTGDYSSVTTYPYAKKMVIKWTESGVIKVGMISIPPTYSAPNTTVTIIGDTMASIDSGSLKYAMVEALEIILACFGSIDAVSTNQFGEFTAFEPYRVIGADVNVGTAGTTNSSTFAINKNGTTMFATKPTLATTVRYSPTPFTADNGVSLALGDQVTGDIDAIQTTVAVDAFLHIYLFPTKYLYMS